MLTAILAVLLPLLAAILYQPISTDNTLNHSLDNILFVTAHPDDECMFFAPTILGLQAASNPPKVHILSLSFGNASGLGETRQGEFIASLNVLGIPEGRRHILDHPELQDGMRTKWDPELISKMLNFYVVQHNISKILTFDPQGISGHSNHRAAFHSVRHYTQTHTPAPQLFTLITVPNAIKYLSIVAPLQAKIDLFVARFLNFVEVTFGPSDSAKPVEVVYEKTLPVFVSGFNEYLTAHRAMRQHWSQLVWFRWLYVIFSRYMWVNEWQQLKT